MPRPKKLLEDIHAIITCECSAKIQYQSLKIHVKSRKHLKYMAHASPFVIDRNIVERFD